MDRVAPSDIDTDVVVVGAGPTGLTLACGLLLHGLSVRVVDRAAGPATTSRANFLHARGSEVLDRIGGLGTLPKESLRAMRITTYLGERPLMRLEFGDPGMRTAAPPMVVSQARVEAALRARLAELGAAPEWGNGLSGLRQDADTVLAELDAGTTIRARWLVGCDGTSSTTRTLAGIDFPGVKLTERFLLADLHLDWDLDRGGTTGWVHRDGVIGVMPMPDADGRDDLWRVFAYDPHFRETPSEAVILERLGRILPERTESGCARRRCRVAVVVHRAPAPGNDVSTGTGPDRGRCRARARAVRWAGHADRSRRRREPGLQTRSGGAGAGG